MDGLPELIGLQMNARAQQTLRAPIHCTGVGVHSGRRANLTLRPAAADSGIVFRRTDLGVDIPARFDHVIDTRLCTVIAPAGRPDARVGTVEHVMAALAGCGIDNAIVEIDGPEVPILDGSAASFVFLIECAGVETQAAGQRALAVRRPIRIEDGDSYVEFRPATGHQGLTVVMSIEFEDAAIGKQQASLRVTPTSFRRDIAAARTFGRAQDVEMLQAAGLARGGSLDNAVVVDKGQVLNPGGLRMPDEFVRHKILDVIGDFALAGAPLVGRIRAHKSGHALNNRVLRAMFADDANWTWIEAPEIAVAQNRPRADGGLALPALGGWQDRRIPVAAAPI